MKHALTIAGSDPSGGAGLQADLEMFQKLGVHGTSVCTAVTAQSPDAFFGAHAVPSDFVELQLKSVLDAFPIGAAKTGMLASAAIVRVVAQAIDRHQLRVVVDPVLVGSRGGVLLEPDAHDLIARELFPRAVLVTPNLPELERLTGLRAETPDEMIDGARALIAKGATAVLLKGGHRKGEPLDILIERTGEPTRLSSPRLPSERVRGTGCRYSAAIAALLAQGETLQNSVERAHILIREAIARS